MNIFYSNKNLIKQNYFKLKPIIGDLIDIELLQKLKQISTITEQSILFNGSDDLLLSSFSELCLNYDLRSNYILKNLNFNNYNLLLLLNTNLRLENPLINSKLRQEYLWNNLIIYNFGSKYNLTYKYYQLGNTIYDFIKFIKGQHFLSNLIISRKYKPLLIISSNLLQLFDNFFYKNLFFFLNKLLKILIYHIFVIVQREQEQ